MIVLKTTFENIGNLRTWASNQGFKHQQVFRWFALSCLKSWFFEWTTRKKEEKNRFFETQRSKCLSIKNNLSIR